MSEKHTPGPWVVKPAENEQGGFDIDSEYGYHIAETIGGLDDEEEANARLIAAAPDLLEALKFITEDVCDRFDMNDSSTNPGMKLAVKRARTAIAKATGETL